MFFDLSEVMENCKKSGKKSGKSQGISRWMISGNPDSLLKVQILFIKYRPQFGRDTKRKTVSFPHGKIVPIHSYGRVPERQKEKSPNKTFDNLRIFSQVHEQCCAKYGFVFWYLEQQRL